MSAWLAVTVTRLSSLPTIHARNVDTFVESFKTRGPAIAGVLERRSPDPPGTRPGPPEALAGPATGACAHSARSSRSRPRRACVRASATGRRLAPAALPRLERLEAQLFRHPPAETGNPFCTIFGQALQ